MHPLHEALVAATHGRFPPVDGVVEVHPPGPDGQCASVEFTGHAHVLTHRDEADVLAQGVDAFGGADAPDFLRWLAGPDGLIGSHDMVLVATGLGGGSLPLRDDLEEHPRVERARRYRRDVRVHGDSAGFVCLGRGLVDRLEVSVELLPETMDGEGSGRRLIQEGLRLVPEGDLMWAQVAPGNAASVRAFLSAGFTPIGAEVLIEPRPAD
ncbi:MAG: hypothetical protein ACR2O6_08010 [Ilumatobacteraceae bacterium]